MDKAHIIIICIVYICIYIYTHRYTHVQKIMTSQDADPIDADAEFQSSIKPLSNGFESINELNEFLSVYIMEMATLSQSPSPVICCPSTHG